MSRHQKIVILSGLVSAVIIFPGMYLFRGNGVAVATVFVVGLVVGAVINLVGLHRE
jgi:hypothetical protein